MSFVDLEFLILAQIGMDITIIVVFIYLIRRLRAPKRSASLEKEVGIFESFLADADKTAQQFKEQLEEKHHLIRSLNEQLDKRIISLKVLLHRAEVVLSSHGGKVALDREHSVAQKNQRLEIAELAKQGHRVEEIAKMLSIPRGEVKLVLDVREKFSQRGAKEGLS